MMASICLLISVVRHLISVIRHLISVICLLFSDPPPAEHLAPLKPGAYACPTNSIPSSTMGF